MKHKLCEDGPHALAEELAALPNLTVEALKQRWRVLYRTEPPVRISPSLLLQSVAYRFQERVLGGLKSSTRRLLAQVAEERTTRSPTKVRARPDTVLIREWHGVSHAVTVLENGVLFRRTRYRSLSEVARKITGTRWSGPRFFGLRALAQETEHGAR